MGIVCFFWVFLVFFFSKSNICQVGTDGLVLKHQDVSSHSAEHPPTRFQFLWIYTGITHSDLNYRKSSNIRRTETQNLNASRLSLQLSLRNILKPCFKSRMEM